MTESFCNGILRMLLIIVHLEIKCTFAYAEDSLSQMFVMQGERGL